MFVRRFLSYQPNIKSYIKDNNHLLIPSIKKCYESCNSKKCMIKYKKNELMIIKDNKTEIKKMDIKPVQNYPDI